MQPVVTENTTKSVGLGINMSGDLTGFAMFTSSSGNFHAFRYSGGTMQDLGTFGGGGSHGFAINDCGQIVGDLDVVGGPYPYHAFLYSNGAKNRRTKQC
jgi:probable HAF family extracellular repeat protein